MGISTPRLCSLACLCLAGLVAAATVSAQAGSTESGDRPTVVVARPVALVKKGPGTFFETCGRVVKGSRLAVLGAEGDWLWVWTGQGQGWVHVRAVAASGDLVSAAALAYRGSIKPSDKSATAGFKAGPEHLPPPRLLP